MGQHNGIVVFQASQEKTCVKRKLRVHDKFIFNSDIRNEPQERQKGRGNRGVGIGKMVKNYGFIYFFLTNNT